MPAFRFGPLADQRLRSRCSPPPPLHHHAKRALGTAREGERERERELRVSVLACFSVCGSGVNGLIRVGQAHDHTLQTSRSLEQGLDCTADSSS